MSAQADRTEQPLSSPASSPATAQPGALIVTAIEGIETTAATLAQQLRATVEIAATRATALRLLARRSYSVVILDQILADSDPDGADLIWKDAGVAIPLQVNFALAGSARLVREIKAALTRRQREQQLAGAAATAAIDSELKNAITGFLLESRLALAEEGIPPGVESRLRNLAEIADRMRERLVPGVSPDSTTVSLRTDHK
jgi:signal transduction histidine kinase